MQHKQGLPQSQHWLQQQRQRQQQQQQMRSQMLLFTPLGEPSIPTIVSLSIQVGETASSYANSTATGESECEEREKNEVEETKWQGIKQAAQPEAADCKNDSGLASDIGEEARRKHQIKSSTA